MKQKPGSPRVARRAGRQQWYFVLGAAAVFITFLSAVLFYRNSFDVVGAQDDRRSQPFGKNTAELEQVVVDTVVEPTGTAAPTVPPMPAGHINLGLRWFSQDRFQQPDQWVKVTKHYPQCSLTPRFSVNLSLPKTATDAATNRDSTYCNVLCQGAFPEPGRKILKDLGSMHEWFFSSWLLTNPVAEIKLTYRRWNAQEAETSVFKVPVAAYANLSPIVRNDLGHMRSNMKRPSDLMFRNHAQVRVVYRVVDDAPVVLAVTIVPDSVSHRVTGMGVESCDQPPPRRSQKHLAPFASRNAYPFRVSQNVFLTYSTEWINVDQPLLEQTTSRNVTQKAAIRCDQGLYMGFSNIVQAMVDCLTIARSCGREAHFPHQFQHGTFSDLFDTDRLIEKVAQVWGITLRFVPGPVEESDVFVSHSSAVRDASLCATGDARLKLRKELEKEQLDQQRERIEASYSDQPEGDRGSAVDRVAKALAARTDELEHTVSVGDVWRTRYHLAIERHHLDFLRSVIFGGNVQRGFKSALSYVNSRLRRYCDDIITEMRKRNGNESVVAVHLRFESDRWALAKGAASKKKKQLGKALPPPPNGVTSSDVLAFIKLTRRVATLGGNAVYVASGGLVGEYKDHLSRFKSWIRKEDVLNVTAGEELPFYKSYTGKWFDGKPVEITNSTGALVDFFVLVSADITVLADYSSFGEYIALARCARSPSLATYMYQTDATLRTVNCNNQVMNRRGMVLSKKKRKKGKTGSDAASGEKGNVLETEEEVHEKLADVESGEEAQEA